MMTASSAQLRQRFLEFFQNHAHTVVQSAPLIPANDPTLMFVNAGMVPFKEAFVGQASLPYSRAASSQKCMRVSGKHNDLEEVGRTARHQTFFEMLGNFSFGDYFKEEAISLAWTLITKDIGLDPTRLWITVFGGADGIPADEEAEGLWQRISGLPAERILRKGMADNFWSMGDTGPCGPCTEIHYDLGGDETPKPEHIDSGRIIEIWNNVFMQFDRHADGTLVPLPAPSVDTGMGLERLAAVCQGQTSNYHTDLFMPLLQAIGEAAKKGYQRSDSEDDVSMRVIADHARATAFLIADGIQPSNEGRGYVLRRIMRRAIRHGKRLGLEDIFFPQICGMVVHEMGAHFSELREAESLIAKVVELEETGFRRTLDTGLSILHQAIERERASGNATLPGEVVFKLYDTYGFPKDLTEVIAQEHRLSIDEAAFSAAMEAQRERSRGGTVGDAAVPAVYQAVRQKVGAVQFCGYPHEDTTLAEREGQWRVRETPEAEMVECETTVVALIHNGIEVDAVDDTTSGHIEVVVAPTPFYGESGGQIGDSGTIISAAAELSVTRCQKPVDDLTVCRAHLKRGQIRVGERVWAGYPSQMRQQIRIHHSATHLLHLALRRHLGEHVKQAGSLVTADKLRFDFTHFEALKPQQIQAIERDVQKQIDANTTAQTDVLPFNEAKERGAMALFGEKYGDTVRVLSMGDSVEFCGGTHVRQTGDVGMLVIVQEEAVASGVRRIEAEAGIAAQERIKALHSRLDAAARCLSGARCEEASEVTSLRTLENFILQTKNILQTVNPSDKGKPEDIPAPQRPAPLHEPSLEEAQRLRDLWQGLVYMTNTRRATEAAAIAERLREQDNEGILACFARWHQLRQATERQRDRDAASALANQAGNLVDTAREIAGIKLLAAEIPNVDGKGLRSIADQLRVQLGSGVLCLASRQGTRVNLLIAVTADLTSRLKAGELVRMLAPTIGGKGGGKSELAQAGGDRAEGIPEAFAALETHLGAL